LDQRGCGVLSYAELRENNSLGIWAGDIEKSGAHLGIEQWAAFGGSWGAPIVGLDSSRSLQD